jgi:hypothetical protein
MIHVSSRESRTPVGCLIVFAHALRYDSRPSGAVKRCGRVTGIGFAPLSAKLFAPSATLYGSRKSFGALISLGIHPEKIQPENGVHALTVDSALIDVGE